MVVQANRVTNLTRITDPWEAAVKHYADSLALLHWLNAHKSPPASILDIGTGAGYPAVPLAVFLPDWFITAIDGTAKKADFVARYAAQHGLANLRAEHAHARHWQPSAAFEIVVMRAVGPLGKCLEAATPHVAIGGRIIAYKTATLRKGEREEAGRSAAQLGLEAQEPYTYELVLREERLRRSLQVYLRPG